MHSSLTRQAATGSLGARYAGGTTTFTVWAPDHQTVELVAEAGPRGSFRAMTRDGRGYWSAAFEDLPPGSRYQFRLNGAADQIFPDPASRFQPHGVHGASEVVDPSAFAWTDRDWTVPPLDRVVCYELHVGTFTSAGTFAGVIDRLGYLARLGITAIELMPIGDFAGAHNWGYDGAAIFAPARCYGTPDSLRALVDAAHRFRIAVILDVIYNHFGPDGAYVHAFSPYYFSDRHESPWGRGLNFDGPYSADVRRFFIENALQWVQDYHVDGFRVDATHAIVDDSSPHFLAELTSTVRAEAQRDVLFIAEDHRNLARMMEPVDAGGLAVDAVWADDFHHQARVHTAGDRDGYYMDYTGSIADLATTLKQGWFFTGQMSTYGRAPRGTDPSALDPRQFVICVQNHDQVGNRADGGRLHHQIDPASYRALTVLLLLAPHTPLLFMGQEWAATTPFQFFTDHHEDLGRQVTEGRRAEFASFDSFGERTAAVPNPQEHDTFHRSRLRWAEIEEPGHAAVLRLYQRLLHLRRSHPAMHAGSRDSFDVQAIDDHTLSLGRWTANRSDTLLAIVRLSGEGTTRVPADAAMQHVLLSTEDPDVVDAPRPIRLHDDRPAVEFARPGAIVLTRALTT